MTGEQALAALKKAGRSSAVRIYTKHGVTDPCWGVSFADLRALARKIKRDHTVAVALWKSGVHDARVLATMVADPGKLESTISKWLSQSNNYLLTDAIASAAASTPGALALAREWIESPREWTSAAGWNVIGLLASRGELNAGNISDALDRIERTIHSQPNRTRYAMNNALIGIGGYVVELRSRALEIARKIGKVEVDHGETGCKTPDAAAYIAKMNARQKARQ